MSRSAKLGEWYVSRISGVETETEVQRRTHRADFAAQLGRGCLRLEELPHCGDALRFH
jgi:hypothetical protein